MFSRKSRNPPQMGGPSRRPNIRKDEKQIEQADDDSRDLYDEEQAALDVPRKFNVRASPHDLRDKKFQASSASAAKLPASYTLRPEMPPVLDQGPLGTCGACASANALRFLFRDKLAQDFMPSRLFIYFASRVLVSKEDIQDDDGVVLRDVCKAVSRYVVPPEIYWTYDVQKYAIVPETLKSPVQSPFNMITYRSVEQNETAMKAALASGFPLLAGITIYESFMSPAVAKTGMVPMPNKSRERVLGGHAILIVGYTSQGAWICQNSWSGEGPKSWGDRGYMTLPKPYMTDTDLAFEFWVFSDFAS